MNIRIYSDGQNFDSSSIFKGGNAQQAPVTSQTAKPNVDAAQDTAAISSAGSQLSSGFAVRQEKVDSLRAQVVSGTYSVDTKAVATSMSSDPFWSPSLPIHGR
jgi:flagellar biosynthesis anti-sigma factor FlgM